MPDRWRRRWSSTPSCSPTRTRGPANSRTTSLARIQRCCVAANPACLDAIRALIAVLRDRNIPYVIVGGAALQLRYGITSVRATADIDTIVLADTWQEYDD